MIFVKKSVSTQGKAHATRLTIYVNKLSPSFHLLCLILISKNSATVVLEELAKAFRKQEINKHPSKINQQGFFELLLTPHLRTLDLRHWRGNSNVLQLAALKSPVTKSQ